MTRPASAGLKSISENKLVKNGNNYIQYLEGLKKDKEQFKVVVNTIFSEIKEENHLSELPFFERRNSVVHRNDLSRTNSVLSCSSSGSAGTLTANFPLLNVDTPTAPSKAFLRYDHATWYCSNAKQTASYFVNCFGFEWLAHKGLETGSKVVASHVVRNGCVVFEFVSPIIVKSSNPRDQRLVEEIFRFIRLHGDGVKDISFTVSDVDLVYNFAINSGAKSISKPKFARDEYGYVRSAIVEVFDDVYHTLVQRDFYKGVFLPGYRQYNEPMARILDQMAPIKLENIDHCVQNEDWNTLDSACNVYSKIFGFHQFWSVDEKDVSTKFTALRSVVMASANEEIKMPINEPAKGLFKSQIEEFLDFYNGPGVQHIAVSTNDIVATVKNMKLRGAEFIKVPDLYYEKLTQRLLEAGMNLEEDVSYLRDLGILVDFDEMGYLLQIFTKPLTDRPTFFLEIIQRHNHKGFGKGNFKALFEAIEAEQRIRGTLSN